MKIDRGLVEKMKESFLTEEEGKAVEEAIAILKKYSIIEEEEDE